MPRLSTETCESCMHFDDAPGVETDGACRRHAPRMRGEAGPTKNVTPLLACWPRVRTSDWCGEWTPPMDPEAVTDLYQTWLRYLESLPKEQ